MKSKNKIMFYALLTLAVCFAAYLIAQIIVQEPITEKLTDLANPSSKAAQSLVEAYLDNQPDQVRDLLTHAHRNRIYHKAALAENPIKPEQAMRIHTESLNGLCSEWINDKKFYVVLTKTIDEEQMQYEVRSGTAEDPGASILSLLMLKEKDGNWRCEKLTKLQ